MKKGKIILIIIASIISVTLIYAVLKGNKKVTGNGLENILINSDFEVLGKSGKPESWSESFEGGWLVDLKEVYQGKRSMKATVGWSWLSQDVPVEAKKYYLLKAYIKSDITASSKTNYQNAFLTLECLDEHNKVISREWGAVDAKNLWQLKRVWIYTPGKTNKIRVKLAKRQGEGSVWFDEVELNKLSTNLVLNSGFEILSTLNRPEFWSGFSKDKGWFIDKESSYRGEISVRGNKSWQWLLQDVPARPGGCYRLKIYIKSDMPFEDEIDYKNTLFYLECMDAHGAVLKKKEGFAIATSSWAAKEISICAPVNTYKIRIKLAKRKGEGSVWFDNVELIELPFYLRIEFLRRIVEDRPFFIFYFSLYFFLIVSLIWIILKK